MSREGDQITTITFFRYTTLWARIWAFGMMQFAHGPLSKVAGLEFYKLMGSGKKNFNPFPDWSVYALLQVWQRQEFADDFFGKSPLMERYRKKSGEQWTLYLKNISVKGQWSGGDPFAKSTNLDSSNPYITVLTRATIKPGLLLKFWKFVPTSQKGLVDNTGLIYTKGIGETPFAQMATFSLWRDVESLKDFAYRTREHQQAIQKTRSLDWYKEEMFSRFQPYRSVGQWDGKYQLPEWIGSK